MKSIIYNYWQVHVTYLMAKCRLHLVIYLQDYYESEIEL